VAGGAIPQCTEYYLATRGTAMRMKTNNDESTERWSGQQSEENGNRAEET
jgi:hypothetical protein